MKRILAEGRHLCGPVLGGVGRGSGEAAGEALGPALPFSSEEFVSSSALETWWEIELEWEVESEVSSGGGGSSTAFGTSVWRLVVVPCGVARAFVMVNEGGGRLGGEVKMEASNEGPVEGSVNKNGVLTWDRYELVALPGGPLMTKMWLKPRGEINHIFVINFLGNFSSTY